MCESKYRIEFSDNARISEEIDARSVSVSVDDPFIRFTDQEGKEVYWAKQADVRTIQKLS